MTEYIVTVECDCGVTDDKMDDKMLKRDFTNKKERNWPCAICNQPLLIVKKKRIVPPYICPICGNLSKFKFWEKECFGHYPGKIHEILPRGCLNCYGLGHCISKSRAPFGF